MSALTQNPVLENMEKIKILFQESKEFASQTDDFENIISKLDGVDNEYRSVAYEAVAMAIAEQDIVADSGLTKWQLFSTKSSTTYSIQLHVGLGWALAKENKETAPFFNLIAPFMISRVLDGIGYYDGVFKQRATIKNFKISDKILESHVKHYDQGIGRSIWYLASGNPLKCKEFIDTFPIERQTDLWRGIGIASVYVGGCDDKKINELITLAHNNSYSLALGAALAVKSRVQSNSVTNDTILACSLLLKTTAHELVETMNKLISDTSEMGYNNWLKSIEQEFISSKIFLNS